jgi:serine protease Do
MIWGWRTILEKFSPQNFLIRLALLTALSGIVLPLSAHGHELGISNLRRSGAAFREVARQVSPAVVFIRVERLVQDRASGELPTPFADEFFRRFFGLPKSPSPDSENPSKHSVFAQGSGFLVSPEGYILTNHHVIGEAKTLNIHLADGREFTARVIGCDPHSDVAVIKIEADALPVLPLGDSDALEVGDWVLAVGNPFGLTHTITAGIVSAKGRSSVGFTDYENFIQTDAAINPGNSGGPLIDLNGDTIGMNTAIFSQSGGYMGIGFAIPINMVKAIADQLIEKGFVTRGYLGVTMQSLTPLLARGFGIEGQKGVLLSQISSDSPGEKAGLRPGDLVVDYAGQAVAKIGDFHNRIAMTRPGTRASITVLRDGERRQLEVVVGKLQDGNQGSAAKPPVTEKLGLTLQPLTLDLAQQLGYLGEQGVVVTRVRPGSLAADAGIDSGTLIKEVNRTPVKTEAEVRREMEKSPTRDTLLFLTRTGKTNRYVALQLD